MERPDPDALLDRVQRDAEKRRRGRLKVFFGASAGVGKTFAMLQAGHRRVEEGEDAVIGVVETHGRRETLALLDGLEIVPLRDVAHRGRAFPEFDLDAALARQPGLILIDELAHSNVPGARHAKRWQDVHELLEAGIDVHTTVNVQHLESLNDVVGQITGVRVRETVPDRIFDLADEVTLVDVSAEELLERLRDGKVYLPQQAARAAGHFFRKGNLIALRELALRRTADRVDAQMREYRADQSIERLWQARERLVVCIGPGDESAALVRAAARLAASLKADWLAVYVETPALQRLPDASRKRTLDALRLAADMGAETVTLEGADAAATLVAYARMRNVSRLVAGKSARRAWTKRLKPPFADKLAAVAGDFDLVSIAPPRADGVSRLPERPAFFAAAAAGEPRPAPAAYAAASLIAAAISALAFAVSDHMDLANLVMLYLLGVVFAAFRLGRGPGVYLSFLSVAAFDFFFVQPRLSFAISDTQYLLTFAVMLITSLTISHLTSRLRHQARSASRRERRTAAMYAMVRELGAALTDAQIIDIATRHVSEVFGARMAILLPDSAERVRPKLAEPDPATALPSDKLSLDVAQWVYDKQQAAGRGTDTLPASAAYYLPLKAPMRTRGVLALLTARPDELAVPEQQRLIETFAAQIALALERVHYVEISRDALVGMESERLRNALLATISHDLRTPLTAIVGLAAVLSEGLQRAGAPGTHASEQAEQAELAEAIHDESLHMVSLVNNLLDMARLQAGGVRLDRQWSMLEEVVGAALAVCRRVLGPRKVTVSIPADLPLVRLDAVLMERLLVNVLENACKYAHPGTALEIDAGLVEERDGPFLKVAINDLGPGLTSGTEAAIFEKFARGDKESAQPGVGLGLAICRAIIDAHGGRIGARNRRDAGGQVIGAGFWFTLPANEIPPQGAPPEMPDDDVSLSTLNPAP
ncbi:MAG: DUF4118 domain-containing protein [Janthinobacterium lividum]